MAYAQVTLAQFQTDLQQKYESMPFWTQTEATNAINEALRTWNMLTGQWKQRIVLPTVANQTWYSVPGTLVYNMRMEWNSIPMEPTALGDLDYGQLNWEGQVAGSAAGVPTSPAFFAPAGLNIVAIWPADSASSNSLTIDGVAATPQLVNQSDFIDIGQDEFSALLSEALHISLFKATKDWYATSLDHHRRFLLAAAYKNSRLRASTFFRKAMGLDFNRGMRPMAIEQPEVQPQPQPAQQGA